MGWDLCRVYQVANAETHIRSKQNGLRVTLEVQRGEPPLIISSVRMLFAVEWSK